LNRHAWGCVLDEPQLCGDQAFKEVIMSKLVTLAGVRLVSFGSARAATNGDDEDGKVEAGIRPYLEP
jgi:hypothetical protein